MTRLQMQTCAATIAFLLLMPPLYGAEREFSDDWRVKPMPVITEPIVETANMGGVPSPSVDVLKQMHESQYILRARGGELTKVTVEKTLLPHCKEILPQGVHVDLTDDGTLYVRQLTMLCKSTDGGLTWTSQPISPPEGWPIDQTHWSALRDGSFLCVAAEKGLGATSPAEVFSSQDEGRTWKKLTELKTDVKLPGSDRPFTERYCYRPLDRLQDDTLFWGFFVRENVVINGSEVIGGNGMFSFRSTDGGKTWDGPELVFDWGSEGAMTLLPSGRIFATMRYQRQLMPGDSSEMAERAKRHSGWLWKHLFILDSDDGGQTWSTPRQLTTVFGQTFGYPAAQSDGTVVVVHDTRYGPGGPGSRAVISHDEGATWEDEVYYLDSTVFTGSNSASIVLPDDTIVTIAASSQAANNWVAVVDHTDLVAIRWKPVKAGK